MTSIVVKSEQMPLPIDLSSFMAKLTDQQFYEFCRTNPELRIERNADGEIVVMPPAFSDTGNRNSKISGQLFVWSEVDGTGEVFDSSAGFTLPNSAIRSPDASWIRSGCWNALPLEKQASFAAIVPDFVVELSSSGDTLVSLQEKLEEYIVHGVRLGLFSDRKNRQVHGYRPGQEAEILDNPDAVCCEPELPEFVLKMAKIW